MARSNELSYSSDQVDTAKVFRFVKLGAVAVAALILVSCGASCFHSVPVGSRGVVTQFGKIEGIRPEGLVVLPPWQNLSVFNIRAETAVVKDATALTNETQPAFISLKVRYNIDPAQVAEVFEHYSHTGDLSSYIDSDVHEVFRAVAAKYSATELVASRAKFSQEVQDAIAAKVARYYAQVVDVSTLDFHFADSYMNAIHAKVEQEQLRVAAQNKVLTIEAEQHAKVVTAQAEADAVKAKADGDAYATRTAADAEAYQIKVQQQSLNSSPQVLELRRVQVEQTKAEKWDGALPTTILGGSTQQFLDVAPLLTGKKQK